MTTELSSIPDIRFVAVGQALVNSFAATNSPDVVIEIYSNTANARDRYFRVNKSDQFKDGTGLSLSHSPG
jgi:hypothetical protein